MGRQRKPVDVIRMDGKKHLTKAEIEARKVAEEKIKPKKGAIKCPAWLDPEAKKYWKVISKELQGIDLLTNVDVGALAICCDAYSKFVQATEEIEKHGMMVVYTNKGGQKNVVANPYVAVANKYSEIYKKYCGDFGLTPVARVKIAQPQPDETPRESKWDKYGVGNGG